MNLLLLTLIALFLEGRPESTIYSGGYRGFGYRLFGKLRINYHVFIGARWLLWCVMFDAWWFFPAFCVIEDWGFWLFSDEWPTRESWIGRMFGGFTLIKFIPNAWWMGLLASCVLYWVQSQ